MEATAEMTGGHMESPHLVRPLPRSPLSKADLINAAIDELVKQRYELPAFSTLDRLVGRVRALVYGRIFRTVTTRMTPELQQIFEMVLDAGTPLHRSYFSLLKLAPPSPTLSHLKAWHDRLTWLLHLGSMESLLCDIPPAIIRHFAAEARALDASELNDYTPAKRLTLLACLIQETLLMDNRNDRWRRIILAAQICTASGLNWRQGYFDLFSIMPLVSERSSQGTKDREQGFLHIDTNAVTMQNLPTEASAPARVAVNHKRI